MVNTRDHEHVGLFYSVLGSLPPTLRSMFGHIQLAAIAKSVHIKKYGANAILSPIKFVSLSNDVKHDKAVFEFHHRRTWPHIYYQWITKAEIWLSVFDPSR